MCLPSDRRKDAAFELGFASIVHRNKTLRCKPMISCQDQPLQGTRILIAEDDPLLALDTKCLLEDAGADVVGPAGTLADTLALARSASLSCAVLDINLRREFVFPAAEVLKE